MNAKITLLLALTFCFDYVVLLNFALLVDIHMLIREKVIFANYETILQLKFYYYKQILKC